MKKRNCLFTPALFTFFIAWKWREKKTVQINRTSDLLLFIKHFQTHSLFRMELTHTHAHNGAGAQGIEKWWLFVERRDPNEDGNTNCDQNKSVESNAWRRLFDSPTLRQVRFVLAKSQCFIKRASKCIRHIALFTHLFCATIIVHWSIETIRKIDKNNSRAHTMARTE